MDGILFEDLAVDASGFGESALFVQGERHL